MVRYSMPTVLGANKPDCSAKPALTSRPPDDEAPAGAPPPSHERGCPVLFQQKVLIERHGLEQGIFRLGGRHLLVKDGQITAHAAGFLQQRGVVGGQKRPQFVVAFRQLRFQPQHLVGQAGDGGGGSPLRHFLFEIDVFLHAGLEISLGVFRIFTGGAQKKNGRFRQHADIQYGRLGQQSRILARHAVVRALLNFRSLHQGRLRAQEIVHSPRSKANLAGC